MKNIRVLPTDKSSRLLWCFEDKRYYTSIDEFYFKNQNELQNQNIYITNDEEIKEGDWFITKGEVFKCTLSDEFIWRNNFDKFPSIKIDCKKIILTTDQDLINDGVQSIDDEFLEWFIKNPSCENVEVKKVKGRYRDFGGNVHNYINYRIIIPKEEPKQRLEKYSERFDNKDNELVEGLFNPKNWGKRLVKEDADKDSFEDVTKYKKERSYSEEDMKQAFHVGRLYLGREGDTNFEQFIEEFKNK